ncbi:MAG: hypothetical protein AB8H47_07030 [Bacteroidia bacterium]
MNSHSSNIHIPWGTPFNRVMPYVGYLLLALGIFIFLTDKQTLGVAIFCLALIPAFLQEGIIVSPSLNQVKSYWGILGLKFGKWQSLTKYKYLVILRSQTKYASTGGVRVPLPEMSRTEVSYDLYIMSANHLKRIMLTTFTDQKDALEMVRDLSEDLNLEFVKYNPGQIVHQKRH